MKIEIDVVKHVTHIWNWMLANVPDFPEIMPPPIKKVYSPRGKEFTPDTYPVAELSTAWYKDDMITEAVEYEMKVYPEVFTKYLNEVFVGHPSQIAANMLFNHVAMHELFHYYRNYKAWLPTHDNSDVSYDKATKTFRNYIDHMGKKKDEQETEALTLRYLSEMHGINPTLKPVFNGSFARFMNRKDSTYIDRCAIINMLNLEEEIQWMDDGPEKEELVRKWGFCILHHYNIGKKQNVEVVLI